MSASNWTQCPVCARARVIRLEDLTTALSEAYGTVPAAEYEAQRAELDAERGAGLQATFREDYEISGADTGTIQFSYGGACGVCGASAEGFANFPVQPGDKPE